MYETAPNEGSLLPDTRWLKAATCTLDQESELNIWPRFSDKPQYSVWIFFSFPVLYFSLWKNSLRCITLLFHHTEWLRCPRSPIVYSEAKTVKLPPLFSTSTFHIKWFKCQVKGHSYCNTSNLNLFKEITCIITSAHSYYCFSLHHCQIQKSHFCINHTRISFQKFSLVFL